MGTGLVPGSVWARDTFPCEPFRCSFPQPWVLSGCRWLLRAPLDLRSPLLCPCCLLASVLSDKLQLPPPPWTLSAVFSTHRIDQQMNGTGHTRQNVSVIYLWLAKRLLLCFSYLNLLAVKKWKGTKPIFVPIAHWIQCPFLKSGKNEARIQVSSHPKTCQLLYGIQTFKANTERHTQLQFVILIWSLKKKYEEENKATILSTRYA